MKKAILASIIAAISIYGCSIVERKSEPAYSIPYYLTSSAIDQTSRIAEKQKKYDQEKIDEQKNRFGVIISSQVIDESHVNNGAGARLGAALGQAQYVDNANWNSYSATKQLGAGLAGSIIGAAMMDKPSETLFNVVYFIKTISGNVKQVNMSSSSPVHLPEGACVESTYSQISLISQNNCAGISPN